MSSEKFVKEEPNGFVVSSSKKKKQMKVAALFSSYDCSNSIFKQYDDQLVDINPYNPSPNDYEFDMFMIEKPNAVKQVTDLVNSNKYDIVLNLCDGEPEGDTAGVEVVECLENLKIPYTGANSKYYSMTKSEMKSVANLCDVPTPAYAFVYDTDDDKEKRLEEATKTLAFPLIVKHHNGGGSLGMTEKSKVNNKEELEVEVDRIVKAYGGALIEEFVTGREFTVLVAENPYDPNNPLVYEPLECILPSADSFKHFYLKFVEFNTMHWVSLDDVHLSNNLKLLAKKIFVGSGANSFGRLDFRMCEKTGTIHFLEINAQCGVFYWPKEFYGSADFILELCQGHKPFLENLFLCALISFERNHNVVPPIFMPRLKKVQIEEPPSVHTFPDEIVV